MGEGHRVLPPAFEDCRAEEGEAETGRTAGQDTFETAGSQEEGPPGKGTVAEGWLNLQKVTEKLQHLSDQFGQMSQRKQDLQTQIATCEARIDRAERLVAALGQLGK